MRLFVLLGGLLFLLTTAATAQAATLYMDPQTATLNRGDAVTLTVRLDTDEFANECINVVEAVIAYSPSIIPVDVSTSNSIFSMWVERPTINRDNHTITFAGGIPNGYCGRVAGDPRLTNSIAELVFRAPGMQVGGGDERGSADIQFTDQTIAYQNDGFGTPAQIQKFGARLTMLDTIGSEIKDEWRTRVQDDQIPPEPFSIELVTGETAVGERSYIVFSTTDKQTGISHYEVLEERVEDASWFSFGAVTAPWETVSGPVYILKDQSLSSIIRVRAIDKAGNEYMASLQPSNMSKSSSSQSMLLIVGGLALLMCLIVFGLVIRKVLVLRRHTREAALEEIDTM